MRAIIMSSPGILHARSRIHRKPAFALDEPTFLEWYQTEHIPDVFAAGGVPTASQWKSQDPEDEFPYLTAYELPDLATMTTKEFAAIPAKSDRSLRGNQIADMLELDVAVLNGDLGDGGPKAKWLIVVQDGSNAVDRSKAVKIREFEKSGAEGASAASVSYIEFNEQPADVKGKGDAVRVYKLLADLKP
jgi:hypothetical protein